MSDSTSETLSHINRVRELLYSVIENLHQRAQVHDASKLGEDEKPFFDEAANALKGMTYGSKEYKDQLAKLKPALDHHYAANSHHPEHYKNGVKDMTLFDLIEMLCDWKAAGERHADGSMTKSLSFNKKRFKIPPALQEILEKSAQEMVW